MCLRLATLSLSLSLLAPAVWSGNQKNAGRAEFGADADFKSAEPIPFAGGGFTVTSSFRCGAQSSTHCGLAGTRYAYFLTVLLDRGWQPIQPIHVTVNAAFDPSLSSNNTLAFGLIDGPADTRAPAPAAGTDVSDCVDPANPAAQTACIDGFLAASSESAGAVSFTLQPSYTFNGRPVRLKPGDRIVLYATSYLPPDCGVAPPAPSSSAEWTCEARPLLDVSFGGDALKAENVFAPGALSPGRRLDTPSAYFTAGSPGAARLNSPSISLPDPQGDSLLSISSSVLCAGETIVAGDSAPPCGQNFRAGSQTAGALPPSEYVYLYTLTFAESWSAPLRLEINAPFDPALSQEFGLVSFGIFQDAPEADNSGSLTRNFPPAPCASAPPPALSSCIDGLLLTTNDAASSPLVFTLDPGSQRFEAGDTVVLFASSFYPPSGCLGATGPQAGVQDCPAAGPITLRDAAGISLGNGALLGPSVSSPPVPALLALTPASAAAGEPGLTLTVTGASPAGASTLDKLNFVRGSQVLWNGAPLPPPAVFQGVSQLSVQIPAANLAARGSASIAVRNPPLNPDDPGQISAPVEFTNPDDNPLPMITGLSPSSVFAGSPLFPLTVTGTNFVNGSMIQVGEAAPLNTTFNSSTSVTATIPAADVAQTGPILISVVNPLPGGGTSNALQFQVLPSLPPTLTSISPTMAIAGGAAFVLSVTGTNFAASAAVQANGAPAVTVFNTDSSLTATIPATAIAAAGALSITVLSPAPNGVTSNALPLQVNNPVPVLSSLSPASVLAGSATFTLTIAGTGFVSGASVLVNTSTRTPSSITATSLAISIPAALVAATGTLSITVTDPAPGGGVSNTLSLPVLNPVPTLSSLSQTGVLVGSAGFNLILTGTNFVTGSSVQVNATTLTPAQATATSLTAPVPAGLLAATGMLSITVSNPSPGGGTSSALALAVSDFSISSASGPQTVNAGQTATFTINLATQGGALPSAETFTCSGLPAAANCSFTAPSLPAGTASGSTALAIATTARSSILRWPSTPGPAVPPEFLLLWLAAAFLSVSLSLKKRALARHATAVLAAATLALIFLASCGAGANTGSPSPPPPVSPMQGTPAGPYMITVTASSGTATRSTTVMLQVN
ncbi:MAG TPA: hypothetical protein VKG84_12465 [Candidatus Acidoferrales bacterium]|nr:hypothetical protein [Candidatus Acidoferrales bacterium]